MSRPKASALLLSLAAGFLLLFAATFASKAADCGGKGQKACEKCEKYENGIPIHFGVPPPQVCVKSSYSCNDAAALAIDGSGICRERSKPGIDPLPPPGKIVAVPKIIVQAIPDQLVFLQPDGSRRIASGLVGWQAIILNAGNAEFSVPDGRAVAPSCERLAIMTKSCAVGGQFCTRDAPPTACVKKGDINLANRTCEDLGIRNADNLLLRFPMFNIMEWEELARPNPPFVMVNANWFDIRGPRYFPYNMPCTDVFGYLVDAGNVMSEYSKPDVQFGEKLDAFVVTETGKPGIKYDLAIRSSDELRDIGRPGRLAMVKYAVGGFITARNGIPLPSAQGNKPTVANSRSAIGLSPDNRTMTIVVVQGGPDGEGLDAEMMARYLIESHGAKTVINLDNSGSSQFLYALSDSSGYIESRPGDRTQDGKAVALRPVPAVLVVSAGQKTGACNADGICSPDRQDLRKRTAGPLDQFAHVGQFYSNDAYLFDDARLAGRGTLEQCAQRCLADSRCANFTYAYANAGGGGQFCTLFPEGTKKLSTDSDYQFYSRQ